MSPLLIHLALLRAFASGRRAISIRVRGAKGLMPHMDTKTFICTWRSEKTKKQKNDDPWIYPPPQDASGIFQGLAWDSRS